MNPSVRRSQRRRSPNQGASRDRFGAGRTPREAFAALAVDVVVLALHEGQLWCLLVPVRDPAFSASWAFPGGRVQAGESLEECVGRVLRSGPPCAYLEQLRTFGEPNRDPHARVVATAYLALAPEKEAVARIGDHRGPRWFPAASCPALAYDHGAMLETGLERLRAKLGYTNIVYGLLDDEFTLSELHEAYETILGRPLDRRNFRKKILSTGMLVPLHRQRRGPHRPAALYRFGKRRPMVVEMI